MVNEGGSTVKVVPEVALMLPDWAKKVYVSALGGILT
jgi:hypothetical protein